MTGLEMNRFKSIHYAASSLADLDGWPALDEGPPTSEDFNKLVDFSKVADAPLTILDQDYEITNCDDEGEFCNWSCTQCVRPTDVLSCPNKRDYTSDLVDFLDSQGLKATFFIVGSRVVELHTWSHPMLTSISNEEVIAELQWTAKIINETVGLVPKYMRPPYGDFDDRIRDICAQLGYIITIWDRNTNDWMIGDDTPDFNIQWVPGNFTQWVKENSNTGHISLEHDIYEQSAAQGPKVVPILQKANFNVKPVASCLGDKNPYMNRIIPTATGITGTLTSGTGKPSGSSKPSRASSNPSSTSQTASTSKPSNLGSPTPMSSSERINYNNWLIILGLIELISNNFS
ncbi:9585_t:CDS:2 [Diversispora eburnea]|uniref:9585_t:CDS:1 n=1 Tax=Diversispora eburnea TaxID=1213867 RepID=A0A9N9FLF1_9GLOM|nr:9585_t:CDS:2 [Diversispora eburnea]